MKILIIEDDPMVAMIHQEYCKKTGLVTGIHHVSNLADVKGVLQKWVPDLILMDNYLPDGKGVDYLSQVNNIPIVMITAASDTLVVQQAIEQGVIDYLVKPFTYERFEQALQKAKRYMYMMGKVTLSQGVIDEYFYGNQDMPQSLELPKGLTKITLSKVVDAILEQTEPFSTQTISEEVTISRITIKKYLNFLVDIGFLSEDAEYLTFGRPVSVYTLKQLDAIRIVLEN